MGLTFTVGGTKGTFDGRAADEIAVALDHAFGDEGEWEGADPVGFGELDDSGWSDLQEKARAELGKEAVPNLLALGGDGRGVYVPGHVRAMTLPLAEGGPLRCASLPGLRVELEEIASLWGMPLDDDGLRALLRAHRDQGDAPVTEAPEILAFASLALAANEAARRDCPLWVVGPGG